MAKHSKGGKGAKGSEGAMKEGLKSKESCSVKNMYPPQGKSQRPARGNDRA